MKIALGILCIVIAMIDGFVYFKLSRFYKIHAEEDFEVHKKYILSRIILIYALILIIVLIQLMWFLFGKNYF